MKWSILLTSFIAFTVLAGCGGAPEQGEATKPVNAVDNLSFSEDDAPSTAPAETDGQVMEDQFVAFFTDFMLAWQSGKAANLAGYIHPDYGVFMVHNPGAYVVPGHFADAAAFVKDNYIYDVKYKSKFPCDVVYGKQPHFSCDLEAWDIEGCIRTNRMHTGLVKMMDQMAEWELGEGKKDPAYPIAQKMDALETVAVYQTDLVTGWNFAMIDGKWYWVMVDMVEPCSA